MLRRHGPRLLGGTGARPAFCSEIGEIYPVNVARSSRPGRRLNIVIPTTKPAEVYGGVATAIRCGRALFEAMRDTSETRVIVTSDDVERGSMCEIATRFESAFALAEPNDEVDGMVVVDLHNRRYLPLALRAGDVFFATAWWTADLAFRLRDRQRQIFGAAPKIVYLIQDFEPGFYQWSARYALAEATYSRGGDTVALLNSEELANFLTARYHLPYAFHVPYAIDPEILAHLKPTTKEKKVLAYGRPSAVRNLFETLVEGIRIWQGRNAQANSAYEVVFAGEEFDPGRLEQIEHARCAGKLPLGEYAGLLNETAIGISLMVSPHPGYSALEMAAAGCVAITSRYEAKDLSRRAENILSLDVVTPEGLADALDAAAGRVRFDAPTPLAPIRNVPCKVPAVEYAAAAEHL